MKCAVPNCDRKTKTAGLCGLHYQRKRRHGDPLAGRRLNGSGYVTEYGYVVKHVNYDRKGEHVLVAEKALGKPLPKGVEVHHVNEDKADNRPSNLVICPDRDYHRLLHVRTRAYDACGHADWKRCWHCKQYSDPAEMRMVKKPPNINFMHVGCLHEVQKNSRIRCRLSS